MATFTHTGTDATVKAASVLDYADLCEANRYARKDVDAEWHGAASHAEALRMAREGSPKHREMMTKGMQAVRPFTVTMPVAFQRRDVAGERPDVGRACAGAPMNMVRRIKRDVKTKPVTRWLVHMGGIADVTATQRVNRGAAIMALLDSVEQSGMRVEVELLMAATHVSDRAKTWATRIMLKEAEQPLDIDVAAFCIVCPAIHRWLDFGLRQKLVASLGMGTTCDINEEGRVYFPACTTSDTWNRPDTAAATVRATYEAQIGAFTRPTV